MKNLFLGLTVALGLASAQGHAQLVKMDTTGLMKALVALDVANTQANLINWKVGDFHKIKIDFAFGGGTGRKEATKEDKERNAIWLVTTMNLMGQAQKTEALYDRSTGKVLEMILNGEQQETGGEDAEIEILEQKETEITVPAGKFECVYIKATLTSQGQKTNIQAWINPVDVNLDGMLKTAIETQFGPLTMILENFGPRN